MQLHTHEVVEVCAKILYQIHLCRTTLEQMWGFSVEAELIENTERQDELCCYVSRVEDKSVAMQNGNYTLYSLLDVFDVLYFNVYFQTGSRCNFVLSVRFVLAYSEAL